MKSTRPQRKKSKFEFSDFKRLDAGEEVYIKQALENSKREIKREVLTIPPALIFRPTLEQFANPMEYINRFVEITTNISFFCIYFTIIKPLSIFSFLSFPPPPNLPFAVFVHWQRRRASVRLFLPRDGVRQTLLTSPAPRCLTQRDSN